MKNRKKIIFVWIATSVLLICVMLFGLNGRNQNTTDEKNAGLEIKEVREDKKELLSYEEALTTYDYEESRQTVKIAEEQLWNQEVSPTYNVSFRCEEGSYYIQLNYTPLKESDTDIMACLRIDGKIPFEEAQSIKFPRSWVAESENYFDENDNEFASYLVQEEELLSERVRDSGALYEDGLVFGLETGNHTLELEYISGSMMINSIEFVPVKKLPTYEEYKGTNLNQSIYAKEAIMIQAENPVTRSSRNIPSYMHNSASMTPYEPGKKRINAFGGGYWYEANSSGTWEFEVPEDGYYKVSMRVLQDNSGLNSYRQILIDGEVPFQELSAYAFSYGSDYRTEALGGDEPYLFYLTKGKHKLTMRTVTGEVKDSIIDLRKLSEAISLTVRDIQTITGTSPDSNFDYELDKKMPDLLNELAIYENNLIAIADRISAIDESSPVITATLYSDAEVIGSLIEKPEKIPMEVSMLTTIQGDVNNAVSTLQSQPLAIDWICLQAPEEELYEPNASVWDRIYLTVSDFIASFDSNDEDKDEKVQEIDLWVSRDSEWGNMMERMISEEFEPKYGIKVNLNLLPSGNTTVVSGASPLLLSVVSGDTPDIALGCDSKTPVELAIRGQLEDLSKLEGFEELIKQFPETTIEALSYEGGVYGVPETMDMPVMVYRSDVFERNDIEVPETWEEVWRYTLPQLSQVDGNFYMGSSSINMYAMFLHQNGGEFYDEEGNCTLNSDEAMTAFEQWTKCFVQYNVPQSANFYNEMREGTLPIGICSLGEYMQLLTYASELTGKLKVTSVPGILQEDGTIARYGSGDISSAVVFKDTGKQEECMTFLKWWTSEDVQSRFAAGVESRVGATGRWFSANVEAFYSLSWSQQELDVLKECMPWYKNIPNVLGGYYSSRSITNAWTRTVISGTTARDSIEQSYEEISTQIERKKLEYGRE